MMSSTDLSGRRLKILDVSQNYHIVGGADRSFLKGHALLGSKGHTVIPLAADSPRNLPTEWSRYFPRAADFERPGPLDLARFVYSVDARRVVERIIQEYRPDIAHLHIYYGKLTSSILGPLRRAGIPIVQTLREYKLICPVYTLVSNGHLCEACKGDQFWQALPRRCNRGSLARTALSVAEMTVSRQLGSISGIDHFIAVSDFVRGKMIEFGLPPERITTIRNFVEMPDEPPSPPGDYVLYFGRMERIKGIFTLAEASAALGIPTTFLGSGSDAANLQELVTRRGWANIRLIPRVGVAEVARFVAGSRFVVAPSEWHEPLGLVVLESMSHARAVIGTTMGGTTELLVDGETGILTPAGDVAAMSDAIERLWSQPELSREMGMAGYRRVKEEFTAEKYYEQLMALYGRLIPVK